MKLTFLDSGTTMPLRTYSDVHEAYRRRFLREFVAQLFQ